MRLDGWSIEGFGILAHHEVRPLSPGLSVFLGRNEAGKSTLLAFLRWALFGFEGAQDREIYYPPQAGGRYGGRVFLDHAGAGTTIERIGEGRRKKGTSCTILRDGQAAPSEELEDLLGGATAALYRSVFAFSTADAAIRKARDGFRAFRSLGDKLTALKARRDDAEASARDAGPEDSWCPPAASPYWVGAIAAAFLLATAAAGLKGQPLGAGALFLLASLTGGLARYLAFSIRDAAHRRARAIERLEQARKRMTDIDGEKAKLDVERRETQARIVKAAAALGLKGKQVTEANLEQVATRVQRMRAELARWEGRGSDLTHAVERERRAAQAARLQQEQVEERDAASRQAQAAWEGWKQRRGLPAALKPDLVVQLLQEIVRIRGLIAARRDLDTRARQFRGQVDAWEAGCRGLLARANAAAGVGAPLVDAFLALYRHSRDHRERMTRIEAIREELRSIDARLRSARDRVVALEKQRDALYAAGGAADEQEFRRRLGVFRKRQTLREDVRKARRRLAEILGGESEVARCTADLREGRKQEWEQEDAKNEIRAREIEEELKKLYSDLGGVKNKRKDLESSGTIPEIDLELGQARVAREKALRDWHVAAIAQELIKGALSTIMKTRQPQVLAEASTAFNAVTGSAYVKIVLEEDGETLGILDSSDRRKRPEQLSRGTVEQLYVCLRLGLIREFARKKVALPVVMDDVLVNFDTIRARAMAGVLGDFAREHQVLIFTCHPETVALLREVVPDAGVYPLDAGAPVAVTPPSSS